MYDSEVSGVNDCGDRWTFGFKADIGAIGGAHVAVFKKDGKAEYFCVSSYIDEGIFDNVKPIDLPEVREPADDRQDMQSTPDGAVKTIYEKTPCGGAYSKVFYCDSSGEPTSPEKSCQMIIHEYSEGGALLRETVAFTNGWSPNIDE